MNNLIRRNDEHWQDNLLGLTLNERLDKEINKRHAQHVKELSHRFISESSYVAALDSKHKILDIGFNCPDDLILDNFGTWLAAFIRQPTLADAQSINVTDIANSAQTLSVYSDANPFAVLFNSTNAGNTGTQLQVGSGTTAATRADYMIETAFGTSPENTRFATGAGGYGGGAISFSGAISAGGSGTVNEMGFFGYWSNTANSIKTVMLFHDILSSGVAFVTGNTLNASYSITL